MDIPDHLHTILTEYQWGPYQLNQEQPTPQDDDDEESIAIDDTFDWPDKVTYEVTEIQANLVVARSLSDGTEINFEDVQAVREAIKQKNAF